MFALVLSALLATSPSFASPPPPPPPPGAEDETMDAARALASGRFAEVADKLGLDASQRTKVSDAVYAANTAKVDIDARIEKSRLEVRHLLGGDTVDDKAVLKAVDTLTAAEGELRRNRVQLVLSIRKVLTPDQWRQLVSIRQAARGERHEREGDDE